MFNGCFEKILACSVIFASTFALGETKKEHFEFGIGTHNQAPILLTLGYHINNLGLRLQGSAYYNDDNDYWCAYRFSTYWKFFRELPFNIDFGLSVGYAFANAPNKMHQALNDANGARYTYPYNYKELEDFSADLWAHLYGFYTQVSVPLYKVADHDHDSPNILWGAGYMIQF